jgi:hypothetical protein
MDCRLNGGFLAFGEDAKLHSKLLEAPASTILHCESQNLGRCQRTGLKSADGARSTTAVVFEALAA